MSKLHGLRGCVALCILLVSICTLYGAEIVKIEGVIVGRSGDEIIVKFGSGAELAFQLTENTRYPKLAGSSTPEGNS